MQQAKLPINKGMQLFDGMEECSDASALSGDRRRLSDAQQF